jgi:hypothetical protein
MSNCKGRFYLFSTHSRVVRRTGIALASALVAAMSEYASGSVVFTNFGVGTPYDVTQGNPVGNDFVGDHVAEANSFFLTGNATFQSLAVPLSCAGTCPASEDFAISLAASSGGSPAAVIESFAFTGVTLGALGSNNAPITATSVLRPLLLGGTEYWITVTSSPSSALAWNLNSTNDTSPQATSTDGGVTWFSPSGMTPSALQVNGIIPEPSAGRLLGGGLLGLILLRRFKGDH